MAETVCIFHGNCADGFTAAWVVRRYFQRFEHDVSFVPGFFGKPPPDVVNKDVIITDFSYPRATLQEMVQKANTLTILDHHITAEKDLYGVHGLQSVFDVNRAGCRITWDYYFPNETPPQLLLHVEDRDLWRFALRSTREIQAAVFSFEYTFQAWDWLMKQEPNKLVQDGEAIERKHFKDIRELIDVGTRKMSIGGCVVPVVNVPYTMASDAGNILSKTVPNLFAGSYYDTDTARNFSLRSLEGGMDVSAIAFAYGGGGHKHASGFRVPRDHELAR